MTGRLTLTPPPLLPAVTGKPSRGLLLALAVSIALHAGVLMLHFQFPDAAKALRERGLEVILVNSRTETRPADPQAIAQVNFEGGGTVETDVRAMTPLPPAPRSQAGSEAEAAQPRPREPETRQPKLVSPRPQPFSAPPPTRLPPAPEPAPQAPRGIDLATSAREMIQLEAEIGRNIEERNRQPRRKYLGAQVSESRFAAYIEDWRLKMMRVGDLNYPDEARGKLYGSLVLTVAIRADGSLERVEINRSSGNAVLDNAARRIAQLASPYAAFPPAIRQDTDILEITRTWTFTHGDSLSAQ